MNILVKVNGRSAIPVRAIPFLTHWEVMSPDEVAEVLSDTDEMWRTSFKGLRAFGIGEGHILEIAPLYWENIVSRRLQGISDQVKATETTHDAGLIQWREAAINALPHDAFVWCDEYEPRFKVAFGEDSFGGFLRQGKWVSGESARKRIDESYTYDILLEEPFKGLILECLRVGHVHARPRRHTGVCDLSWSEAQPYVGDKFSPEQFREGWPTALEPSRLGNLQFSREGVDPHDMKATNSTNQRQHWVMEALTGLCQRKELKCEPIQHIRRDGKTNKVVLEWSDYLIEPRPFLDWLAQQNLEPSRFIVAWCNANGVSCDQVVPTRTPEVERQHRIGWYDSTLDASYWLGRASIAAAEAAQLLSGENPLDAKHIGNWLEHTSWKDQPGGVAIMSPKERQKLLGVFEEVSGSRALVEWHRLANERALKYDPWLDEYLKAIDATETAKPLVQPIDKLSAGESLPTKRVPASRAQEAAVIAQLIALDFDPVALPPYPRGGSSEAKKQVKAALGYSDEVFKKAWQRLSDDGKIQYRK